MEQVLKSLHDSTQFIPETGVEALQHAATAAVDQQRLVGFLGDKWTAVSEKFGAADRHAQLVGLVYQQALDGKALGDIAWYDERLPKAPMPRWHKRLRGVERAF